MTRQMRIAGWIILALVCGVMVLAGAGKVFGFAPDDVKQGLEESGLKDQTVLIGIAEIVSAVLLLLPRTWSVGILLTSAFLGRRDRVPHDQERLLFDTKRAAPPGMAGYMAAKSRGDEQLERQGRSRYASIADATPSEAFRPLQIRSRTLTWHGTPIRQSDQAQFLVVGRRSSFLQTLAAVAC